MDNLKNSVKKTVKASEIAKFLTSNLYGNDIEIKFISPLDDLCEYSLAFSKEKVSDEILKSINNICFISSELPENLYSNSFIIVKNPRLAFAKAVTNFFVEKKEPNIGLNTFIDPSAKIGKNVIIGNNCTIGKNVEIGDYTEIRHNVVISDNVKIGKHCLIMSNTVIGEEGFGFEYEEDGTPYRIPHLGTVEIGDNVEIGNLNSIDRGTIKNTIIKSNVKTDHLVMISHNSIIGKNTMLTAFSEISGSVIVGENCWLGVNCCTMQKIKIGDNSLIGIGSVVLKDVPINAVVAGNPAKILRFKDEKK